MSRSVGACWACSAIGEQASAAATARPILRLGLVQIFGCRIMAIPGGQVIAPGNGSTGAVLLKIGNCRSLRVLPRTLLRCDTVGADEADRLRLAGDLPAVAQTSGLVVGPGLLRAVGTDRTQV